MNKGVKIHNIIKNRIEWVAVDDCGNEYMIDLDLVTAEYKIVRESEFWYCLNINGHTFSYYESRQEAIDDKNEIISCRQVDERLNKSNINNKKRIPAVTINCPVMTDEDFKILKDGIIEGLRK